MHPDTALSVALDAICARHQHEPGAGVAIVELRAAAGDRLDILHQTIGEWVGYFDDESRHEYCAELLDAFPAAAAHVDVGRRRRGHVHSTTGY
ncbi:hypothetical protein [Microbacterium sp. KR10-403]|uniref:hypothetical protein n=1 Tax=Microbacterium sp. KR10-403 TaxID=3158581 RepID=UPI0032E4EA3E